MSNKWSYKRWKLFIKESEGKGGTARTGGEHLIAEELLSHLASFINKPLLRVQGILHTKSSIPKPFGRNSPLLMSHVFAPIATANNLLSLPFSIHFVRLLMRPHGRRLCLPAGLPGNTTLYGTFSPMRRGGYLQHCAPPPLPQRAPATLDSSSAI